MVLVGRERSRPRSARAGTRRTRPGLEQSVVPWITESVGAGHELITLGASMGAYHAVHFAFQRADLAPLAIGLSGNYDAGTWHAWGERGDATYFANPTDYVAAPVTATT